MTERDGEAVPDREIGGLRLTDGDTVTFAFDPDGEGDADGDDDALRLRTGDAEAVALLAVWDEVVEVEPVGLSVDDELGETVMDDPRDAVAEPELDNAPVRVAPVRVVVVEGVAVLVELTTDVPV